MKAQRNFTIIVEFSLDEVRELIQHLGSGNYAPEIVANLVTILDQALKAAHES